MSKVKATDSAGRKSAHAYWRMLAGFCLVAIFVLAQIAPAEAQFRPRRPPPTQPPPTEPPPPTSGSLAPQGIFVVDDGDTDFSTALASANVDGGLIRVPWSKIEATEGVYNWTTLCSKVTQIVDAKKSISLVVYTLSPTWLTGQVSASETWSHPQYGKTVVPWSSTGQAKMKTFLTNVGNHDCGQGPLKSLSNIKHVDAPILGMVGIRHAPSTDITTLKNAVVANVEIVRTAFGANHVFYTSLFPLSGCCGGSNDAATIRDAILAKYPDHAFFIENWTGSGPGPTGTHATLLQYGATTRTFPLMVQACGYWYDQSRIPCSFDNTPEQDTPLKGYNQVVAGYKGKYMEIYPDDVLKYTSDMASIHSAISK